MAEIVHVAGPCEVKIEPVTGDGDPLEDLSTLGYTRNMADVTREAYWLDVPNDLFGGDDGPPIDIQYLGEVARIRLELTKWDTAIAEILERRVNSTTVTLGKPYTPGTKMFESVSNDESYCVRVVLASTVEYMNFPLCIPRAPIEIGKGTKFSTLICEFEAHENAAGVLYDSLVAGQADAYPPA